MFDRLKNYRIYRYHILYRFRDQNIYCFDVIVREAPYGNELVVGQLLYNVASSHYVITCNRSDYRITEEDVKEELIKLVKNAIKDYKSLLDE